MDWLDPSRTPTTSPKFSKKKFPRLTLPNSEQHSELIYIFIILLLLEVLFAFEQC